MPRRIAIDEEDAARALEHRRAAAGRVAQRRERRAVRRRLRLEEDLLRAIAFEQLHADGNRNRLPDVAGRVLHDDRDRRSRPPERGSDRPGAASVKPRRERRHGHDRVAAGLLGRDRECRATAWCFPPRPRRTPVRDPPRTRRASSRRASRSSWVSLSVSDTMPVPMPVRADGERPVHRALERGRVDLVGIGETGRVGDGRARLGIASLAAAATNPPRCRRSRTRVAAIPAGTGASSPRPR